MTTFRCARCGATLESTGPAEAEAWADEHTDTEHGDEARWPNSFAITYPGSQIPGVHYRWPHGWDPRTAFYNATTGDLALDELERWQLTALLVAGRESATSEQAAANDAHREGNAERGQHFDEKVARMNAVLDQAEALMANRAGEAR